MTQIKSRTRCEANSVQSLPPRSLLKVTATMKSSLCLRRFQTFALLVLGHVTLLSSALLPVTCSALEIRRVQACSGIVLRLRGDIKEGDFSRLRSQFRGKEAIIGFDLSSDGGILEEGLRIAELARRKKLTVYVTGQCNSGCTEVFFAAAKRYFAADSKIGVHAVSNDQDVEDVASKLLTIKLARLWAKKGVPSAAIGKMVTTPPEGITYLDQDDLHGLGATVGNPFMLRGKSDGGQTQQQTCETQLQPGSTAQ